MVLHMLGTSTDQFITAIQQQKRDLIYEYRALETKIEMARTHVYHLIKDKVTAYDGTIVLKEIRQPLRQQIEAKAKNNHNAQDRSTKAISISLTTLYTLKENNLLREKRKGMVDTDSAAAVLIAAALDRRQQHFTPSYIGKDEPHWWCYSQTPPSASGIQAPIIPRPLPLPDNLEPGTLLWTPWPSFDPQWLHFPFGAVRFSSVTADTLIRWDPTLDSADGRRLLAEDGPFRNFREQTVRDLSQSVLYKLSVTRLSVAEPPALSILWPARAIWPDQIQR
jgi:hypothetical protein